MIYENCSLNFNNNYCLLYLINFHSQGNLKMLPLDVGVLLINPYIVLQSPWRLSVSAETVGLHGYCFEHFNLPSRTSQNGPDTFKMQENIVFFHYHTSD